MIRNIVLFVCLLLVTWVMACKKKNGAITYFSVYNKSGVADLNIAVYASEADYMNGVNSVASGIAPLNGEYKFDAELLKFASVYYVDAHSSDYNYSNWILGDSLFGGGIQLGYRQFQYVPPITSFTIDSLPRTNAMHSLFDNSKGSTTWKAYDAKKIIDGADVWDVMSDDERYVKVIIRKNNTATYYYVHSDTIKTPFTFGSLHEDPVFVIAPTDAGIDFVMFNSFLERMSAGYKPPSIDTATVIIHGQVYLMKKM